MFSRYDLTVVGAGYVGLATAVGLASRGHRIDLAEVLMVHEIAAWEPLA